jgi:hypothetical protein
VGCFPSDVSALSEARFQEESEHEHGALGRFRPTRGAASLRETDLAVPKRTLECRNELAAKDSPEHLDRKKERVSWLDPTRVIGRKSTGRHHAMHMRVKFEFLTPEVQQSLPARVGSSNACDRRRKVAREISGAPECTALRVLRISLYRFHSQRLGADHEVLLVVFFGSPMTMTDGGPKAGKASKLVGNWRGR